MAESEERPLLSFAKGHFDGEPFPDRTNFAYVDHWASVFPDKEAHVVRSSETEREAITYSDLKTASENLAIWFKREFSLRKGERVAIYSHNRLAYVLCEFALSRLGVVSVRIYATVDTKADLTRNLRETECRLLLCQFVSLKAIRTILSLESHDVSERLRSSELPKMEHVICMTGEYSPGTKPFPNWREIPVSDQERKDLYAIQSSITLDDDCTIYSTSGSTGAPKFVMHSQGLVLRFPTAALCKSGLSESDRFFTDRPMAHVGGNSMSMLTVGATMVIGNPGKAATTGSMCDYFLAIAKEERLTCGISFPYLLYDMVKSETAAEEMKKLKPKFFVFGGQTANAEILGAVRDILGAPLVNAYGSTEAAENAATSTSDPVDVVAKYIGQVLPGVQVKIVDPQSKETLPRGQVGSIGIKAAQKWRYLNNEKKMRESHDSAGFFYPGDMALMAENGYIQILGREDDMMSVGTVKIYPGSIEKKLCQHPSVDKAIVFGVPDSRLYEVVGAAILPKPGMKVASEEIIKFMEESVDGSGLMTENLYMPKFVWVVTSFPITASGKVDKKSLRKQCLEKLDAQRIDG